MKSVTLNIPSLVFLTTTDIQYNTALQTRSVEYHSTACTISLLYIHQHNGIGAQMSNTDTHIYIYIIYVYVRVCTYVYYM